MKPVFSADVNKDGLMDEAESITLIKTLSDGVRERFSNYVRSFIKSLYFPDQTENNISLKLSV